MNTCVALALALGNSPSSIMEAAISITIGVIVLACLLIWVLK